MHRPDRKAVGLAAAALSSLALLSACDRPSRADPPPLVLERTIPLRGVAGRIDHMALDAAHARLFVAELGAGQVEAIDLRAGKSLGRIAGLKEPQGVGYLAGEDEVAVTTGGDGFVRFYRAADLGPTAAIRLGEDADDVRIDPDTGRLLAGFGEALAVIDPAKQSLVSTIRLAAHPEGFEARGGKAFVNLPGAGGVAVVDLQDGRELGRWRNPGAQFNFPLFVEPKTGSIGVVYRLPGALVLFDSASDRVRERLRTCGDADDAFADSARSRLYVVCGSGAVDVFVRGEAGYAAAGRVATRAGARTGAFSPSLDRLYVAARAAAGQPAAILVYRPG